VTTAKLRRLFLCVSLRIILQTYTASRGLSATAELLVVIASRKLPRSEHRPTGVAVTVH